MRASQIIQQVVSTSGAVLIRVRPQEHTRGTPWEYDVKPLFTGNKKGWVVVDFTTANAMLTVFKALGEENQGKFDAIHFNKLVDFTWKHVR